MKLQLATALYEAISLVQATTLFTEFSNNTDDLVPIKFTLQDGRSGIVQRQATPCCQNPIPGWPGRDSSWTPSDEPVSYCNMSDAVGREDGIDGYAKVEDCTILRDYMLETDGAFFLQPDGLVAGAFTGLIAHSSCLVSASLDPGADIWDGLWIGNKDVADLLTLALEEYIEDNGMIWVDGYWPCSGPSGPGKPAVWSVWGIPKWSRSV